MASMAEIPRSSPLDTLVRKASLSRTRKQMQVPSPIQPPSSVAGRPGQPPLPSPLLHSSFRASTATELTSNTFLDMSGSYPSQSGFGHRDSASIYSSDFSPPIDTSRYSYESRNQPPSPTPSSPGALPSFPLTPEDPQPPPSHAGSGKHESPIPRLVVHQPDPEERLSRSASTYSNRIPSQIGARNFSRPQRPPVGSDSGSKQVVLERNRQTSNKPVPPSVSTDSLPLSSSPISMMIAPKPPLIFRSVSERVYVPPSTEQAPRHPNHLEPGIAPRPRSNSHSGSSGSRATPLSLFVGHNPASQDAPSSSLYQPTPSRSNQSSSSLNTSTPPATRSVSPAASIYSNYSYYEFEVPLPSPAPNPQSMAEKAQAALAAAAPRSKASEKASRRLQLVQEGIEHHEANRLTESAICFERAAIEDGGCGAGMLMYGLCLRHAWGCPKDEKKAFKWLRKAAESAVVDLETARAGGDTAPIQGELVLAIYEVGQCFFQGWGVPQDKKMAVSYFRVAARLGDVDAQQDLGFCLANGRGCKKDRVEAAKWYRMAATQGASTVGLAWIYKPKYC